MKKLFLSALLIFSFLQTTHADDDWGFGGGGTDTSYSAPDTGSSSFGSSDSFSTNLFGSNQISDSDTSSGGILSAFSGLGSGGGTETQSFGALFTSKNPGALFLDLNGDGVRGGAMDGLLYELMFNQNSSVAAAPAGSRSERRAARQARRDNTVWKRDLDHALSQTNIPLVEKLEDGTEEMTLSDLATTFNGFGQYKESVQAKQVAFESLLRFAVLNPLMVSSDGPVLTRIGVKFRDAHQGLMRKANFNQMALWTDLKDRDTLKTKSGFDVSVSRLFALSVLFQQAKANGLEISEFAQDALRASYYATGFEIKRLKISPEERGRFVKNFLTRVAESSPETIELMSKQVASPEELARLQGGIFRNMPLVQPQSKARTWVNRLVKLSAAAAAVGAWMAGGKDAVEFATSNVALQEIAYHGAYLALPLVGYVASKVGLEKWAKSNPGLFTSENGAVLSRSCEKLF